MLMRSPRVLALMTAVSGVALLAPAAHAAPPVTVPPDPPYNDYYDVTCDAGTPADPSDDFTAQEHHTGGGQLTLKDRKSMPGFSFGTFRGHDEGTFTAEWPDDTTVIWTGRTDYTEKDRRILSIDGDIATVLVGTTFRARLFAPDGSPDSTRRGDEPVHPEGQPDDR